MIADILTRSVGRAFVAALAFLEDYMLHLPVDSESIGK
jgi:hypothetical protein